MKLLALDHITVAAQTLPQGVAYVEEALGVSVPVGGAHPSMGTHNHLLRLGDGLFLEIIAIDPTASAPKRPRWFGLDEASNQQRLVRPQLWTWVVRTENLRQALLTVPGVTGVITPVTRGALSWEISVPEDGAMPFDGAFPTLIEWPRGDHPTQRMAEKGCALDHFEIVHPEAAVIARHLAPFFEDDRVKFQTGSERRFAVHIATPSGMRVL